MDEMNEILPFEAKFFPCEIEAVQSALSDRSNDRYVSAYEKFLSWQRSQKTNSFDEDVLLKYFHEAANTFAPTTLFSMYSMLKNTIYSNHNLNISAYSRLLAFLREKQLGYRSKKTYFFSADEIKKFFLEAPDSKYLGIKVRHICFSI